MEELEELEELEEHKDHTLTILTKVVEVVGAVASTTESATVYALKVWESDTIDATVWCEDCDVAVPVWKIVWDHYA